MTPILFASRRFLLAAIVLAPLAAAAEPVFTDGGFAIRGYDPVAYFTDGRPVRGDRRFRHDWQGATWLFASAEHRDAFAGDPARYAPAYGGFCAFAVSEGKTAPIDPTAWRIVEGKLYLNYSTGIHAEWSKDIPGRITRADRNWPGLAGR